MTRGAEVMFKNYSVLMSCHVKKKDVILGYTFHNTGHLSLTNKYLIFKQNRPRRILRMLLIFLKRGEHNELKELRACFPQIQIYK